MVTASSNDTGSTGDPSPPTPSNTPPAGRVGPSQNSSPTASPAAGFVNDLNLIIPRYVKGHYTEAEHARAINFERFVILAVCKKQKVANDSVRQLLQDEYFAAPWKIAKNFRYVADALMGVSWRHNYSDGTDLIQSLNALSTIDVEFFGLQARCEACGLQNQRRQQYTQIVFRGDRYDPDTFASLTRNGQNDSPDSDHPGESSRPFTLASKCFIMATEAHTIRHYLYKRFMRFYSEDFLPAIARGFGSFQTGGNIDIEKLVAHFTRRHGRSSPVSNVMMRDIKKKLETAQQRRRGHIAPRLRNEYLGDLRHSPYPRSTTGPY